MRGRIQDVLRLWISVGVRALGTALQFRHRRRVNRFRKTQRRLCAQYGITTETPIVHHGPELSQQILNKAGESALFATTSGSSGVPKRIPYTPARVRLVKGLYMDSFCRAFAAMKVPRTSLYVFSTTGADDSLTSLMMAERSDLPPYFSTLQAPYRVHGHPEMLALEEVYGRPAVRLWVMVLSNPGALYATNPSTLALFLEQLAENWESTSALVRDWHEDASKFSRMIRQISARLDSSGSESRVQQIAESETPLAFSDCVPAVSFLCCWDGGYVKPYLDRVWAKLPPDSLQHVPMYSMSTETVETIPDFSGSSISFLPVAPGVFYEFLPIDTPAEVQHLLAPTDLLTGECYTMVVSDAWGLSRYHTEDVFRVQGMVGGLPDLRFERRIGLAFSFTGEKLTGEDARYALDQVLALRPDVEPVPWLTIMPSSHPEPHYKLIVASDQPVEDLDDLGKLLDKALCFRNQEYADKRRSGRLAVSDAVHLPFEEAVQRVGGQRSDRSWETQFKFLPLVTRTWETAHSEE